MDRGEIINKIEEKFDSFDGSRSKHVLFCDWCKLMAISISNQVWFDEKRENDYVQLAKTYKAEELQTFQEMTGLLVLAFETGVDDYLGTIYMKGGMGNGRTGQFFTPFHLAELTAQVSIDDLFSHLAKNDQIKLNEPASGGGAMILAVAKALSDKGVNYQNVLEVTAQDLDWNSVYMSYVQLSIAGINAVVIQGDTLKTEKPKPYQVMYTPMYLLRGWTS